jgi:hypothetical protein
MKNTMLLCAMSVALIASMGVHAADTAELKVNGSVRPNACTLTLTSNGEVDFGRIANSQLSNSKPTIIGSKTVQYGINCPTGSARFAVKFVDNRKSSVVQDLIVTATNGYLVNSQAFGLGTVNGKTIGVYYLRTTNATQANIPSGTQTLYNTMSSDNGKSWHVQQFGDYSYLYSGRWKSWAGSVAENGPSAINSLTGQLTVTAIIDTLGNLPTGNDIPLDGSTSLEMVYL